VAQGKGVYKRGNVWWLAFVDVHGRVIRETSESSDYKAALKKLADKRDAVAKGKEVAKPNVRNVLFADAVEEYLKWAKPQGAYKNKEYMAGDLEARFWNTPLRRGSDLPRSRASRSSSLIARRSTPVRPPP
jgi:hypothetical protein